MSQTFGIVYIKLDIKEFNSKYFNFISFSNFIKQLLQTEDFFPESG